MFLFHRVRTLSAGWETLSASFRTTNQKEGRRRKINQFLYVTMNHGPQSQPLMVLLNSFLYQDRSATEDRIIFTFIMSYSKIWL